MQKKFVPANISYMHYKTMDLGMLAWTIAGVDKGYIGVLNYCSKPRIAFRKLDLTSGVLRAIIAVTIITSTSC
jgi:hypothetical protein